MNVDANFHAVCPIRLRGAEIGLIFLVIFLSAGCPPPDVNEAHYLAKAKHYWNPEWCRRDPFLQSADAHLVFYWTFGWITQFASLPATAWIGRVITWLGLAWAWQRLSWTLFPRKLVSVLFAGGFIALMHWGHMAGEWVIGGVEAKGFAWIFVFWAWYELLAGRWTRTFALLGGSSAFLVLVGGWSVVAAGFACLLMPRRPAVKELLPGLLIGAVCALPGVLPALALTQGVDPEIARQANRIYVFDRLPHHLVFHRFPHLFMARQAVLLIGWLAAWRWLSRHSAHEKLTTLFCVCSGGTVLGILGAAIDQSLLFFPDLSASLLRFYWFRLSDIVIPMAAVLSVLWWIEILRRSRPQRSDLVLCASIVAVTISMFVLYLDHRRDPRSRAHRQIMISQSDDMDVVLANEQDWIRMCHWVSQHTDPDALFLTPRYQQTFKWYAGRAEWCSWKDVPQDAASLVDWWHRQQEVYLPTIRGGGLLGLGEQKLMQVAQVNDIDYIVVDRQRSTGWLPLPRVYPVQPSDNPSYFVYQVFRADAPSTQYE